MFLNFGDNISLETEKKAAGSTEDRLNILDNIKLMLDSDDQVSISDLNEDEPDITDEQPPRFVQDRWHLKRLPYYDELCEDAAETLKKIKLGIYQAVTLNDVDMGLLMWMRELSSYINHYGMRMSKEEAVNFMNILIAQVNPGNYYRNTFVAMQVANSMFSHQDVFVRGDFEIDWKPIMKCWHEVAYKQLEERGLILLVTDFKKQLKTFICNCRDFFSLNATQELLDEIRPTMTLYEASPFRPFKRLELFLPMNLCKEEQMKYGAGLWFDEFWHWWDMAENFHVFDEYFLKILTRLVYEAPGQFDLSTKLDKLFTKLLRSLQLGKVSGLNVPFAKDKGSLMIVYLIGSSCHEKLIEHLKRLFSILESFAHPSSVGRHSAAIVQYIVNLSTRLITRMSAERREQATTGPTTLCRIPDEMRLTQERLDEFVTIILPTLKLLLFNSKKVFSEPSSGILQHLSQISPSIVVPQMLELVYPAIDTITEPHRLHQALSALVSIAPALAKNEEYRGDIITLLNLLVPGLDRNDIGKCRLTFQFVAISFYLIRIADCSEAIYVRNDLTEKEKELCSATANFDSIVSQFIDRLFYMLVDVGESPNSSLHESTEAKKVVNEDDIVHRGTSTVLRGIFENSSPGIHKMVCDRVFEFANEHVYNNRVAMQTVGDMLLFSVLRNSDETFPTAARLVIRKLSDCVVPEKHNQEKLHFHSIWWLHMAHKIIRVDGDILLANWDLVSQLLSKVNEFGNSFNTGAVDLVATFINFLFENLCSLYMRGFSDRSELGLPLEEYLPIREWCKGVNKETWQPSWYIPSTHAIAKGNELIRSILLPNLKALGTPENMNKHERLYRINIVRAVVIGSAFSLPQFKGERIHLMNSHTFVPGEPTAVKLRDTPELHCSDLEGSNNSDRGIRDLILDCMKVVVDFACRHGSDEFKAIGEIITILYALDSSRGMLLETCNRHVRNFKTNKAMLADKTSGFKGYVDQLVAEYVYLHHRRRICSIPSVLRQQNVDILNLLVRLSLGDYSQNRLRAQRAIYKFKKNHISIYKLILPDVLKVLDPEEKSSDNMIMGALHLLIGDYRRSFLLLSPFSASLDIWSTLVQIKPPDKLNITHLIEKAGEIITNHYSTRQIEFEADTRLQQLVEELADDEEIRETKELSKQYSSTLQDYARQMTAEYHQLLDKMVTLANDTNLHWSMRVLAQEMMASLFRCDVPLSEDAIKTAMNMLVDDTASVRTSATRLLTSFLQAHKPKAVKVFASFDMPPEVSAGCQWPIRYGLRDDNRHLQYQSDLLPEFDSATEWNSMRDLRKGSQGFYTYAAKPVVYAPLGEQVHANRPEKELPKLESIVCSKFEQSSFCERFVKLFCVEEKGTSEERYQHFLLFKYLARCMGPRFYKFVFEHLPQLLSNKKKEHQRLGAAITAGVIVGSKLFKWEDQRKLWDFLTPLLTQTLENVTEESFAIWSKHLSLVSVRVDPRLCKPLVDILFPMLERAGTNAFAVSTRINFLHSFLIPFRWRGMELWSRFYEFLQMTIIHQFASVRSSSARALTHCLAFDIMGLHVSPNYPSHLRPIRMARVVDLFRSHLNYCFMEAAGSYSLTSDNYTEVKKSSRLALFSFLSLIEGVHLRTPNVLYKEFIPFIPLLFHYSNDVGDTDLQRICATVVKDPMQGFLIRSDLVPHFLDIINQVMNPKIWWKTRMIALASLGTMIFSNLFAFHSHVKEIEKILLSSLCDAQIEVREITCHAITALLQCKFFTVSPEFLSLFKSGCCSTEPDIAHGSVLGLCAVVLAYPYTVPDFMPDVLMQLSKFTLSRHPIKDSVKRTLSEFKRTHSDSWHEQQQLFNEDQLCVLRDLLISPNYYV